MSQVIKLIFLISALCFFSCANKKKIIYFQGDKEIKSDSTAGFSARLRIDDLLSITVMAMDAEAVKPFNLSTYGQLNGQQNNSAPGGASGSIGYLIDSKGEIEFPVIGKIKLAGLARAEAADLLKNRLKDYLKEPIVNIQVLNYRFTILGDVSRPGVYTVPYERITLVEALGLAGDLNMTALRKNILVIREKDGKRSEMRLDLTSKEIFNSPAFYLQQSDVVYVEANKSKHNSSIVNTTGITFAISITTLLVTLTTLLIR